MIPASQPIKSAILQAFDGLAEGGAMTVPQLLAKLSAPGETETREREAIKVLFNKPNLDPKSVEQLLDSWVGERTATATFTKTHGIVPTYELVADE